MNRSTNVLVPVSLLVTLYISCIAPSCKSSGRLRVLLTNHGDTDNQQLSEAGKDRCVKAIARVVNECYNTSTTGCDVEHAFQLPCRNNIVDGYLKLFGRLLGCPRVTGAKRQLLRQMNNHQYALIFLIFFTLLSTLFISSIYAHPGRIKATMTINGFEKGGSGGGPSKCDGKYHSDNTPVVALSTQWYNHGKRCEKFINIYYKDRSVKAKVVDECDSARGCDNDIVDASKAVWNALRVPKSQWYETKVTWSDA
ncbi:putative RlpA-like double-psi beta-barrel domain-containing protein [Tanacetum coccineum]|uniref:RlpA-like double-psi beta-barrel domain-containing protein n=1 Tax=Tanacetum coccineum TaxID=301880 RepID=A0ABQ4XF57_9ASTR